MATFHNIIDEGEGAVDRLSNLPDHIVEHILSFLETRHAVQTSILSKRWTKLWISVPDLYFDMASFNYRSNFQQILVKVMAQRENNNILKVSRFSIVFPRDFLDKHSSSHVNMVLDDYAASHRVDHLMVKGNSRVLLIELKLNKLEFPKLTNLHLEFCWWPSSFSSDTECFDFSVLCPNLVNLFLSHFDAWRFDIFKISGPKHVNLTMNWVDCDIVEISAPKLTFLKINGETDLNFSVINLPSLKQTEVGHVLRGNRWRPNDIWTLKQQWGEKRLFAQKKRKFFQGLRNAALAMVVDTLKGQPSPFSRLKSLKFLDSVNPLKIPAKVMNYLLSGSPCVETVLTEFWKDD